LDLTSLIAGPSLSVVFVFDCLGFETRVPMNGGSSTSAPDPRIHSSSEAGFADVRSRTVQSRTWGNHEMKASPLGLALLRAPASARRRAVFVASLAVLLTLIAAQLVIA